VLRLLLLSLSVGRQSVSVSATVTAVSEPSVSAVVSVTYGHNWTSVTAPLSATAETLCLHLMQSDAASKNVFQLSQVPAAV